MSVFDRVKKLADDRHESINEVERNLNYSQNTLYRLKRSNPSAKKVIELADYFNTSSDYLLGLSDSPKPDTLTSTITDIFTRQLLKQIDRLDNDHKQRVYAYAQAQVDDQNEYETLAAHQADPNHRINEDEAQYISKGLDDLIDDYEQKHKK